jgi:L-ascorbate metabolism protein UlaG (beta-lactamase superfamily)
MIRLLVLLSLLALATGARANCLPVAGLTPLLVPAAATRGALDPDQVALEFLGHASFLVETPQGVGLVTDYNGVLRPPWLPDIVTMNNAHSTHYTEFVEPGIAHVLRGWDRGDGPPRWDLRVKDMRVRNVTTNVRDWTGGTRPNGNSVFIIETASLCIAHLGHLHHLLTPAHLADIGQIDVLLVPVDGGYTLDQFDMVEVIAAIKPQLLVPMHYFTARTLERFLDKMGGSYPVRWSAGARVVLSRATLPPKPEILVLPGQ